MVVYGISFRGACVGNGNIFQIDEAIFLCGGGITVRVPAKIYHDAMRTWIESRAKKPLIFKGENGARCVMTRPTASGDVDVELTEA